MSAKLYIFMVGGRRCGKTTVLSNIYKQFGEVLHHDVNEGPDLFSICLEANDIPSISDAENAVNEIFKNNQAFDDFIVEDYNPTHDMTEKTFRIVPTNRGQSLEVGFRDIPGEWCNGTVVNNGQTIPNIVTAKGIDGRVDTKDAIEFVVDYIQASTVTIIAIDTPAMMEENGAFNNAINRIGPITEAFKTALQNNNNDPIKSDKLILFVPLKCEKYVVNNNGTINNEGMRGVARQVRVSYANLIDFIRNNVSLKKSVSAAILPIVTIKEVLWCKYGCFWNGERCSIYNDNGHPRTFPQYYDSRNVIYPYFTFRNFSMHQNALQNGSKSIFCEQPLVYSLVYAMNYSLYIGANPTGNFFVRFFKKLTNFFIKNNAIQSEATRLFNQKMKRGDGFEIIQDGRNLLH